MLLNRNVMALALISAGLCFTAGVRAQTDGSAQITNGTPAAPAAQTTSTQTSTTQSGDATSPSTTSPADQKKLAKSLDAITVTGFSNSIEKAIDYQRYADTIQNVVTAADIGGLPDQSIADALTRLPGVAAERIAGQASQINCRGLSGNFIETTLDGREQPSASGSNYIQFDQYPSELINQATVYKTSQASLIEGGVGCTIDMATANPLENSKEQSFNIDARGSYDGQAHDVTGANSLGYRFSAAYQGKFLDDTLGVGLGVASLYQPHVSEQFVGESFSGLQTLNPNSSAQGYVPTGIQLQQNGGEERRTGYLATVVWKPDDHLQVTADGYDSKFNDVSFGYGYRSQQFPYGNANITNPVFGANQTVLGGTVTSVPGMANDQFSNETTADNDSTNTNIFSGGLNVKWNDGPWHLEGDASISHTESTQVNSDVTADPFNGLGTANPTLMPQSTTYQLAGGSVGTASFANPGIYTNLNDMALAQYGVYPYVYHEENKALRLNAKYDLLDNSVLSDLQVGVYDNNHDYEADRSAWIYGTEWGSYPVAGQPPLPLSSSDTSVVCWKGTFANFPCFLKMNGPAILAAYGLVPNPTKSFANSWTYIQSGSVDVHERDAYFMADIDSTLFNHELTGNIGMRVAHTGQTSDGLQQVENGEGVPMTDPTGATSSAFAPLDIRKSYTDYLPSLNLIYHWDDNDQTRIGVSKDLSRPPINQELSGSGSYITNNNTYNVYGSTSALLNPLVAWSYDVDYEHYFDDSSGNFTAGVFYKQIKSFVQDVVYNNFNFASAGITVPINPATGVPFLNGQYQTASNVTGGSVRGAELSFTKTHFLPGFWSGFGVSANYAYTKSAVQFSSTLGGYPQEQGLPGLSRKVASAAVFYDNGIFTSNLTLNYRSSFVSDSQIAVTNQIVYFAPETVLDFQSAYNVTKNVSVLFQVLNLQNTPTRTYFGNPSETGTIQYFGRTFYTGFNIKL